MITQKMKLCRSFRLIHLFAIGSMLFVTASIKAQTPSPSPSPGPEVMLGVYKVTATTEVGWRWRRVDGNFNKYRSDLNYKQGFRIFDTNLLLEGKGERISTRC